MHKARLEAFSDGVIAIIITIMVLELHPPHGTQLSDLIALIPVFLSYVLSFIYLAIYWNNHHHLLQAVKQVNGQVLWANLHLLFWLSLFPFVTAWAGENFSATVPAAAYGVVCLCSAVAYFILVRILLASHGKESVLFTAIGKDLKGKISIVIYFLAITSALIFPGLSYLFYATVAVMWIVPDKRIENLLR